MLPDVRCLPHNLVPRRTRATGVVQTGTEKCGQSLAARYTHPHGRRSQRHAPMCEGAAQGSGSAVWGPRTDGKFLVEDPQKLLQQGSVARVPFITGVSSTIKVYSKQYWGLTCSCSGLR